MKKTFIYSTIFFVGMLGLSTTSMAMEEAILNPKDTANILNKLTERALDGKKGFEEVAERVDSARLKELFTVRSLEREKFARELRAKVAALGQKPKQGGVFEGAVRRAWVDVKAMVHRGDDKAILDVVKFGEEETLDAYQDALSKDLSADVRKVVDKQARRIEDSYRWTVKRIDEIDKQQS